MASITDQTRWRRVLNHVSADLLATVNPANLRGIIPNPHNALRVAVAARADGVAVSIIKTTAADKIVFISSVFLSVSLSADASCEGQLSVRDNGDNFKYHILRIRLEKAGQLSLANTFSPALEIPEGWDVYVEGNNAGMQTVGGIYGWEEDV